MYIVTCVGWYSSTISSSVALRASWTKHDRPFPLERGRLGRLCIVVSTNWLYRRRRRRRLVDVGGGGHIVVIGGGRTDRILTRCL
jgi:hypothetical protein